MNIYTINSRINSKLGTVEDDLETLVTANGTLESDVAALVTAVGTLNTSVGALTTALAAPVSDDTELVDQALTVSGEETPSLTITDVECTSAKIVAIQVNNKGDSTSVKVNVYGKIGNLGYTNVPEITEVTLNATTENDIITFLTGFPIVPYDKIKVIISNADADNATTVDAVVRVIV